MNRTIKFRAWNTNTGTMIDLYKISPLALSVPDDGLFIPFGEQYALMQFTGLTDKNGKEIYEGDILKEAQTHAGGAPLKVYWNREGAQFRTQLRKETGGWIHEGCKVIGNIYENPELV